MIDSATHRRDRASIHTGPFASSRRLALLVWSIPCLLAAAYVCVFAAHFSHNIWLLGWTSDFAFAFAAPQTIVREGLGGHANLGTYGSYVPLWFGLLTERLPLHRQLWQVAPTVLYLLAVLTVARSVALLATRRAAALAVLLAVVVSPVAWSLFMAPLAHNMTYPITALIGAYLVWLARGEGRRRRTAIAVPLLLGVVLGTCFASDNLLVPAAILPLAFTALLACLRRERRARLVALSALTTAVCALPVAWVTSKGMRALGYETEKQALARAPLAQLWEHVRLLFGGLKQLFNGYLGVAAPGVMHSELGLACDAVLLLALLTLLLAAARSIFGLLVPARGAPRNPERLPVELHIIYWAASAAMVCGAYAFSQFTDAYHESFYASTILSIAAVIPLFIHARNPARWLIPVGTGIFFAGSLVGISDYYVGTLKTLLAGDEAQIVALARANHVTTGYSGYWGATSLTWSSEERVKLRPIHWCPEAEGTLLCQFPHGTVGSWYTPKRRHTFLIVEPNQFVSTSITVLPRGLGRPLAAYRIGPVQMYVYPYDIASKVGPPFGALQKLYEEKGL